MTTDAILDRLEALNRAAAPAPWGEFCESGNWWIETQAPDGGPAGRVVCADTGTRIWHDEDDIDCAIAARNALPALLAVARAALTLRRAGTANECAAAWEALRPALQALEEVPA